MRNERAIITSSPRHVEPRAWQGPLFMLVVASVLAGPGCDVAEHDLDRESFRLEEPEPTGDADLVAPMPEAHEEEADASPSRPATPADDLTSSRDPLEAVDNCTYVRTNTSASATLDASCLIGEAQFHPVSCGCSTDDTNAVFLGNIAYESGGSAVDNGDGFVNGLGCRCRWDSTPASGNHYTFALCCTDF